MKSCIVMAALLGLGVGLGWAAEESRPPNILFILSDDQAAWAMGCYGNREIRTPNLDRLAAEGVRMENFFCTSPVCSPARASLLTGRMPSQHGVLDWIAGGNGATEGRNYGGTGESIEYLEGQTGYTDILARHGYVCGITGKWHLGASWKPQKSFSHWFVFEKGTSGYRNARMIRDGAAVATKGYLTDVITDDAIAFLEKHGGGPRPFYLSVHYNAPHRPWLGAHPEELVKSYDSCPFTSCPQEPEHPWYRYPDKDGAYDNSAANIRDNLKGYFGAVTGMDAGIGRLLARLDELRLRENTLVVFLSDNGYNCGHHGVWGKGNSTFPANMYDTSIKVPAIFRHPGRIPAGKVSAAMASGYDIMPTLLDWVGLENPEAAKLPGHSLRAVLLGAQTGGGDQVVVCDEYGPTRMVRTREWKYVHRYPFGPHEFYDLKRDPAEKDNLIADPAQVAVLRDLKHRLESWFVRYVDPNIDGTHEPVTGYGQQYPAGTRSGGRPSFVLTRGDPLVPTHIVPTGKGN